MKKALALILALTMLLGCVPAMAEEASPLQKELIEAAANLSPSENLWFENGLTITGMGVHYNNYPTAFDGCYYWPAIEKLTNAHVEIDWRVEDNYSTAVATTLGNAITNGLPDIIQANAYGITNLVNEGAVIALDDYLDLIPNVVEAVGEDRMAKWREADGHIYTIPTIVSVPGSQTVMIRKDWLEKLGMDAPQTWDDWMAYWRAVK